MAVIEIRNQVTEGMERLVSQWSDKPVVRGLLESYLRNIEKVEQIYEQLLNDRSVFTAVGVQLDVVGSIVGEVRDGKEDPEYRQAILNRIAINNADGTPENIIQILKTITGSAEAHVFEHYPAEVYGFVSGSPSNVVAESLQEITSAGISARLMFDGGIPSFIGATAKQAHYDLAIQNNDELVTENLDFIGVVNILIQPYGTQSSFPHLLETAISNPLCGLFVADSATA